MTEESLPVIPLWHHATAARLSRFLKLNRGMDIGRFSAVATALEYMQWIAMLSSWTNLIEVARRTSWTSASEAAYYGSIFLARTTELAMVVLGVMGFWALVQGNRSLGLAERRLSVGILGINLMLMGVSLLTSIGPGFDWHVSMGVILWQGRRVAPMGLVYLLLTWPEKRKRLVDLDESFTTQETVATKAAEADLATATATAGAARAERAGGPDGMGPQKMGAEKESQAERPGADVLAYAVPEEDPVGLGSRRFWLLGLCMVTWTAADVLQLVLRGGEASGTIWYWRNCALTAAGICTLLPLGPFRQRLVGTLAFGGLALSFGHELYLAHQYAVEHEIDLLRALWIMDGIQFPTTMTAAAAIAWALVLIAALLGKKQHA